ncbi:hypothetical protein [Dyella sp. 2RAB6]|uniref:hypothetical protein n=1 Tax=Dyella sp. 2RAB6 TaxID=3232992 RepID=UPI003F926178
MSRAPDSKSSLQLTLPSGLTLVIDIDHYDTSVTTTAALYHGGYPNGERVALFIGDKGRVRVSKDADGIWFNQGVVNLDWHSLLRVADFLHLDIPQPELPAGREVPR